MRKLFFCLSLLLILNMNLASQGDKFQHPGEIRDLYTVYEYKKSNWDGSHASSIFLYISDSNRLESFKWTKGDKSATLVTAFIDWNSFSVNRFLNHRLRHRADPQLVAVLETRARDLWFEVGPFRDSMQLTSMPWHSYDFDLAGLGFSWRALKNKRESFHFHIADAGQQEGKLAFLNKGRVLVNYLGEEEINGQPTLKYKIDGEGLENKGGHIWIDPDSYMILKYQIALPDEEGFDNAMLQLVGKQEMSPAQWGAFLKNCLDD